MSASSTSSIATVQFIDEKALSKLLGVSRNTIQRWRREGKYGPRATRMGPRRIVYDVTEVETWIQQSQIPGEAR